MKKYIFKIGDMFRILLKIAVPCYLRSYKIQINKTNRDYWKKIF